MVKLFKQTNSLFYLLFFLYLTAFRSDALINSDTGVEVGGASHTPVSGNSYLKAGISVFENDVFFRHFYHHGDHWSGRRRYQTKVGEISEAKQIKSSRKGVEDVEQRPSWLPDNWTMTCKTQNSGATADAGISELQTG